MIVTETAEVQKGKDDILKVSENAPAAAEPPPLPNAISTIVDEAGPGASATHNKMPKTSENSANAVEPSLLAGMEVKSKSPSEKHLNALLSNQEVIDAMSSAKEANGNSADP